MKFKQYLIEKISKKEIQNALENENIIIGAEFEWIPNIMNKNITGDHIWDEYRSAYEAWERWIASYEDIEKEKREIENDLDDLQDQIQDIKDKLEDDLNLSGDEKVELENKWRDLESEQEEKEDYYRELRSNLEESEVPGEIEDYFNRYDIAWPMGDDPYDFEPPNPEEADIEAEISSQDDWIDLARKFLPRIFEDADFIDNYEIGGYDEIDQEDESDLWAVEYDSSVSDKGGVEMKSPPMDIIDFMDILPDALDFIKNKGYTDSSCGLHFHMSIRGGRLVDIDLAKLILFTEEEYIYQFFSNRINSDYARRVKDKVKKNVSPEKLSDIMTSLCGNKEISFKDIKNLSGTHYDAIRKIGDIGSHVEFRYLGGKNYESKYKEIESLIGKFAHTLSIAADKNYKFKDYVKKVIKILDKIRLAQLRSLRSQIKLLLDEIDKDTLRLTLSNNKEWNPSGNAISDATIEKIKKYLIRLDKLTKETQKQLGVKLTADDVASLKDISNDENLTNKMKSDIIQLIQSGGMPNPMKVLK